MKKINVFIAVTLAILMSVGVAFATDPYDGTVFGHYKSVVTGGDYDSTQVGGAGAQAGALGMAGADNMNYANAGTVPVYIPGSIDRIYVPGIHYDNVYEKDVNGRGNGKYGATRGHDRNIFENGPPAEQSGWHLVEGGYTSPGHYEYVITPGRWETVQLPAFQGGGNVVILTPKTGAFAFDKDGLEAGSVAFSKIDGSAQSGGFALGLGGDKEWSSSKTFVGGVVFQNGYVELENDNAYAGSMNKSGAVFFTKNCDFDMGHGAATSNSSSSGGAFTAGFNYAKINNDVVNPSAFNMTGNMAKVTGNPDFSKVYGNGISQTGVQVSGTVATGLSTFSYQHPTMGYGAAASWANITQNGGTITATSGGWSTSGTGQNLYKPTQDK